MTQKCLDEKLKNIRGAVTMAYPMGLPVWDTLQSVLDSDDALNVRIYENTSFKEIYPPDFF